MDNAESRAQIQTVCLMILAAAVIGYSIYFLQPVLVPFVVAVFVVSGVAPIVEGLEKRLGVNRLVACGIAFFFGLVVLMILGISLWASVMELADNAAAYRTRIKEVVARVESLIPSTSVLPDDTVIPDDTVAPDDSTTPSVKVNGGNSINDNNEDDTNPKSETGQPIVAPPSDAEPKSNEESDTNTGDENSLADDSTSEETVESTTTLEPESDTSLDVAESTPNLNAEPARQTTAKASNDASQTLTDAQKAERKKFGKFLDSMLQTAIANLSQTFLGLVSTSVIVLIYVFFLLLGASVFMQPTGTWAEIDSQIRGYLGLKTLISVITGVVFGFALYLFGVPMATTFGVLAFLLNYIPNIGPIVAAVLPVPFIVFYPDAGIGWMICVIVTAAAIQTVSGNVIEPKLMGDSSDLHPVVVLLALMFWGMMWGMVGMFLATPITAGIRIVLDRIDATKPIANVLAGRPLDFGKTKTTADSTA